MAAVRVPVIAAGSYGAAGFDPSILRAIKRRNVNFTDRRFVSIAILSFALHVTFIFFIRQYELNEQPAVMIEEVPERFAQFIIEKPIPKIESAKKTLTPADENSARTANVVQETPILSTASKKQREEAQKSVTARVARVEKKIRSVGVLGMLTGVGSTAKGPAVVDVLGALNDRKENSVDLEAALEKMTGLAKTRNIDVMDRKLVKSKDVHISREEEIDNLLADVGQVAAMDLAKRGSFIIQKPQSIEGAASSNAKRDQNAINAVVSSHRSSIRMSYEKFLRRDPSLQGKITVRFTIAASGIITDISIIDNSTMNRELENEIVRKIRMWRFETIPEGDVTVTYPFIFAPAG